MSSSAMASLPSLRILSFNCHPPSATAAAGASVTRLCGAKSRIPASDAIPTSLRSSPRAFTSERWRGMCYRSLSSSSTLAAPLGIISASVKQSSILQGRSDAPPAIFFKRPGNQKPRQFTVQASQSTPSTQSVPTAPALANLARFIGNNVKQSGFRRSTSAPTAVFPRRTRRNQKLGRFALKALAASPGYQYTVVRDNKLHQKLRAICFYVWTLVLATPLLLVMAAIQPFVLAFDKNRRKAQHLMNRIWATLSVFPFYTVEIVGREYLPSMDEGAVYVANHQSFLDIYTLFLLGRPFKFISKTSNFLIPVIGWAMYLTGHVPLRRLDKRSQMECLKKCIDLVKVGVPVLFFPEGTRSSDGKMASYKKGAFIIATKGNVPVVPISLIGTGKLMPNGLESTLRPGNVKVIIHPPIRGQDAEELCKQTREVVGDTLLKYGLAVL